MGGWCAKQESTHTPDWEIALPGGRLGFLELKAKGKKPTPEQYHRIGRLRSMGVLAGWTAKRSGVAAFLQVMADEPKRRLPMAVCRLPDATPAELWLKRATGLYSSRKGVKRG